MIAAVAARRIYVVLPLFVLAASGACSGDGASRAPATPETLVRVQDTVSFGSVQDGGAAHATWSIANDSSVVLQLESIAQEGIRTVFVLDDLPLSIAAGEAARIGLALAPSASGAGDVSTSFTAVVRRADDSAAPAVLVRVQVDASVIPRPKRLAFERIAMRAPATSIAVHENHMFVGLVTGDIDVYEVGGGAASFVETISAVATPADPPASPIRDLAVGADGTLYVLHGVAGDPSRITAIAGPAGQYSGVGRAREIIGEIRDAAGLAIDNDEWLYFSGGAVPGTSGTPIDGLWRMRLTTAASVPDATPGRRPIERFSLSPARGFAFAPDNAFLVEAGAEGEQFLRRAAERSPAVHAFGVGREVRGIAAYGGDGIADLSGRLLAVVEDADASSTLQSIRVSANRVAQIDVIAELPAGASDLAFGPEGEVYVAGGREAALLVSSGFAAAPEPPNPASAPTVVE